MNPRVMSRPGSLAALAIVLAIGCDRSGKEDHHDHGHHHTEGTVHDPDTKEAHGETHGHGTDSPSGATFKPGQGIRLTEETRKILGVQEADVVERTVPVRIQLMLQVFGEHHRHGLDASNHGGCDVHGSGFLAAETATNVRAGQAVQVLATTQRPLSGVVLSVQKALALGEVEVVIGVSNAITSLVPGEFVRVRLDQPREERVAAVPAGAVLRTAEGPFVYVVRGEAHLRTAVKLGAEADGWVEIVDGLKPGERVLTEPVQTLWLIELRATKGGGHSH